MKVKELAKRLMVNTLKIAPLVYLTDVGIDSFVQNKGYFIERFLEGPHGDELLSFLLGGVILTTYDYIFRRESRPLSSMSGIKIEGDPYEGGVHLYSERNSLTEAVGRFEIRPDAIIFTNLAEDLMCYVRRPGLLGRFRRPRRLDYGEEIDLEKTPYLLFGYGKPEMSLRVRRPEMLNIALSKL